MTENVYGQLKSLLDQQISLDRLHEASSLAREGCRENDHPVGLFVLSRVLEAIEGRWRDGGSMSADAEIMLSEIALSPIRRYLDARARARLDGNRETAYLDEIVKAFLRWSASEDATVRSDR